MSYGILCRELQSGEVIYDTREENTLFLIDEQVVVGSSVGSGRLFTYPAYTGKKIVANMVSPYDIGEVDGWAVISCIVTYPSGIPTVRVFLDNYLASLPVCNGYLQVYYTGANQ